MVRWGVIQSLYLRSTFSFRGTGRGFEKAPLQKHKRCMQFRTSGWRESVLQKLIFLELVGLIRSCRIEKDDRISRSSLCGETVESSHFQTGDPVSKTWSRKLGVINHCIQTLNDYKRITSAQATASSQSDSYNTEKTSFWHPIDMYIDRSIFNKLALKRHLASNSRCLNYADRKLTLKKS